MNNEFKKIITVMCDCAGVDFNEIDFTDTEWNLHNDWTREKRNVFYKWLLNHLLNNKNARFEMGSGETKKSIKNFSKSFIWSYGWKIKAIS